MILFYLNLFYLTLFFFVPTKILLSSMINMYHTVILPLSRVHASKIMRVLYIGNVLL